MYNVRSVPMGVFINKILKIRARVFSKIKIKDPYPRLYSSSKKHGIRALGDNYYNKIVPCSLVDLLLFVGLWLSQMCP